MMKVQPYSGISHKSFTLSSYRQLANMNFPSSTEPKRSRFRFTIAQLLALTALVALHVVFPSLGIVWFTLGIALILGLLMASLATAADALELSFRKLLPIFAIYLLLHVGLAIYIRYR